MPYSEAELKFGDNHRFILKPFLNRFHMLYLQMRSSVRHWVPVILLMAFIFWMSSGAFSSDNTSRFIRPIIHFLFPDMPTADVDLIHGLIRKAGHVTEYSILSFFLFRAFRGLSGKRWSWRWAISAIAVSALYAFSDEFHQSFVSSRTASIVDVGLDTAGAIFAQIAVAGGEFLAHKRNYLRP